MKCEFVLRLETFFEARADLVSLSLFVTQRANRNQYTWSETCDDSVTVCTFMSNNNKKR